MNRSTCGAFFGRRESAKYFVEVSEKMEKHEFFIEDRQGCRYHVTAADFLTRRGGIATAFYLRPCRSLIAPPLMYVRYPLTRSSHGSLYWEFDFWTCEAVEPVAVRKSFPTWDMRRIRKEWRCVNG